MKIEIDCRYLRDKDEAHTYLKKLFNFPEYYGCNLDAFYDMLTMLPFAGYELAWLHEELIVPGSYAAKVKKVADAAYEFNHR